MTMPGVRGVMRSRLQWRRVRSQAITWAFVPTVIVLGAVAIIAYLSYESASRSEVLSRNEQLAFLSASRLSEEMVRFSDELIQVARKQAGYVDNPLTQQAELRQVGQRLTIFDGGVLVLDNRGRVVAAEPDRPQVMWKNWSNRIYFRRLLTGERIAFSNIAADGPDGARVIAIAVPITDADGAMLGAVVGMFRLGEPTLSAFYAGLVRLRLARTNTIYLVDGYGQIIYHPDVQLIGSNLSQDQAVREVLSGSGGAWRGRDRSGRDVVISFAPVPGTPWGLISENDWAEAIGPSRGYGRFLLLLLGLGIVLPAAGFAMLARERRAEALERARLEQELRLASTIQQTLLPKHMPSLPGWQIGSHYQPAQAVGGDFYDFFNLDDGRLGLVIGDVSGKGIPAALVMATTRGLVRSVAQRLRSPGLVLRQVNELLGEEIPPKMFVTCLFAVLDPLTGQFRMANAGHNLPYRSRPGNGDVSELRATGMPLGLMPGMTYEEIETIIAPGDCVLFHSDGLVEARNSRRQMFGSARLKASVGSCADNCSDVISRLLAELESFAGSNWQQEDDVTLLTLQRAQSSGSPPQPERLPLPAEAIEGGHDNGWQLISQFALPSELGIERDVISRVLAAAEPLGLPPHRLEMLKTAVAEAAANAVEHGNAYSAELPVEVSLLSAGNAIAVRITDHGGMQPIPDSPVPDLQAKLAGEQSPRGWGMFLMRHMVDDFRVRHDGARHTVELVVYRKGDSHADRPA
jgi:serine phosphatase RsbU (regulator of sigma subunit)/anti-sigma regulatory factor (Ser/Thr protein kinase)